MNSNALHLALRNVGDVELLIELLISKGADTTCKDKVSGSYLKK